MTSQKLYSILILCTGNSARSVMAEALFSHAGQWFTAYSAGSQPVGRVNPFALEQISNANMDDEYRSKSWHEFHGDNAPNIDFVITVCDNAAAESCPIFTGSALKIHWSFPDPAAQKGSDDTIRQAFNTCFKQIKTRVETIAKSPLNRVSSETKTSIKTTR